MLSSRSFGLGLAAAALTAALAPAAACADTAPYVPGEVIVSYAAQAPASTKAATRAVVGTPTESAGGSAQVLRLHRGVSVSEAVHALRRKPGVVAVNPNYIAHADSTPTGYMPNDTGHGGSSGSWLGLQWNFAGRWGIGAPDAWARATAARRPGARGITIAVLDTGIAYRNWGNYLRSPDFRGTRFVHPVDFVGGRGSLPLDRNGHGTHVAGTIAEQTNNHYAVTGLAYNASIMPVRVLDASGSGDTAAIARGIRYAVDHHAQIINLSLEFELYVTSEDIPEIMAALRYAHTHNVLVVASAGNEGKRVVAYPARANYALSVGATTSHGCLASYSNHSAGLDLVAPGGGPDANVSGDPHCQPYANGYGRPIYQLTFTSRSDCAEVRPNVRRFALSPCWAGTSMAAPHVTGTAALVLASGVLGSHPTVDALRQRLMSTARDLGARGTDQIYGAGLVSAARATAPIKR